LTVWPRAWTSPRFSSPRTSRHSVRCPTRPSAGSARGIWSRRSTRSADPGPRTAPGSSQALEAQDGFVIFHQVAAPIERFRPVIAATSTARNRGSPRTLPTRTRHSPLISITSRCGACPRKWAEAVFVSARDLGPAAWIAGVYPRGYLGCTSNAAPPFDRHPGGMSRRRAFGAWGWRSARFAALITFLALLAKWELGCIVTAVRWRARCAPPRAHHADRVPGGVVFQQPAARSRAGGAPTRARHSRYASSSVAPPYCSQNACGRPVKST
jgi:hypothetical protein